MDWEEHALRDAVLAGHEAAWRVLYERAFPSVYAFVFHRTGQHPQRTEEVVQETWLTAVRRIGRFDPAQGCFEAWLKGIAENVLKNHRRRWLREPRDASIDEPDCAGAAERQVETRELLTLALTELPAHYEAVLRAKYQEQLSVAEIAGRLNSTQKAVESLLSRARDAFRRVYQRLSGD